jgi:alanine racemase
MRSCKVIIHLQNLYSNLQIIRASVGSSVKICLAVKADGYGHGAVGIGKAAEKGGADWLGVVTAGEALELREAGINGNILLLGLIDPENCGEIVKHNISAVVAEQTSVLAYAEAAGAVGATARLHLKIDTGMGRIGCTPEEALTLARLIVRRPELQLEGICSHFPVADSPDKAYTSEQIKRFSTCLEEIEAAGIRPQIVHLANSAGFQRFPDSWFDMVRVGIAAYGYTGTFDTSPNSRLLPVMEVRAPVSFIKRVPTGTSLSYGHTYITTRDTVIGTISAGYADGYRRGLSNRGRVLIRGETYPVVGTVCMDQFLVDLGSHAKVKPQDEAVLFGPDKRGPDAVELASLLDTIPYEITCGINPRVPRIYTE